MPFDGVSCSAILATRPTRPVGGRLRCGRGQAEQLRLFVKAVESHRWAGVWMLMASTGMRRGEVLGLRWSDVDFAGSTLTIRSTRIRYGKTTATSTPKTARGNRTIAIGPATLSALKAVEANADHRAPAGRGSMAR